MGGGGKGGSQSQETKIPEWVKPYAEQNLRLGQAAQQIGYMPYYGPDVAGFNEFDVAAAKAAAEGASAFGYEAPSASQIEGMYKLGPQSSGELYDQAMAELRARRPGQMAYYDQFFINPQTGAMPAMFAQAAQPQGMTQQDLDLLNYDYIPDYAENFYSLGGNVVKIDGKTYRKVPKYYPY